MASSYYLKGTKEAVTTATVHRRGGRSQYAHPKLMSFMALVAARWSAHDTRKFGVGNISLPDGRRGDHKTHLHGLDVDIRPMRKDGRRMACTIRDFQYDQAATAKLIEIFYGAGAVKTILFNDTRIARVRRWAGHDNHLHISLYG